MRDFRPESNSSKLQNFARHETNEVKNISISSFWIIFWAAFWSLVFVVMSMVLFYQLRPNFFTIEEMKKTDTLISKPVSEQNLSLKKTTIGNQSFSIYADTALSPIVYDSSTACLEHIRSIVSDMSNEYKFMQNSAKKNVLYLQFSGALNNYIIRCFNIREGYQIFISGSSTNDVELNIYMNAIYNKLS